MNKIFLIQSALVEKGNFCQPRWQNCYAVRSVEEARQDCRAGQLRSDVDHLGYTFKFLYRYIELELF